MTILFFSGSSSIRSQEAVVVSGQVEKTEFLPEYAYLERPEDDISIAEGSLLIAKGLYPDIDVKHYLECIETWGEEIKARLKGNENPEEIFSVINAYLYDEQGIEYAYDEEIAVSSFLHTVIDTKKGVCQGLTTLYLALTDKLGLPVFEVDVPAHTFVRYDDGERRFNIETTNGGNFRSDEEIIKRFTIAPETVQKGAWMRSLGKKEALGRLLVVRAHLHEAADQLEHALRDLVEAERYISTSPMLYGLRGTIYQKQGLFDRAIEQYTNEINLEPNNSSSFARRAMTYHQLGEDEKTVSDISKAITINAEDGYIYIVRGLHYQTKGELKKALEDYITASALDLIKSEEYYHRLSTIYRTQAEGYYRRSTIYRAQKDYEKALRNINQAIALAPDNPVFLTGRGNIYIDTEEYEKALANFSKAIELSPDEARWYCYRAMAYLEQEKHEQAIVDLNRSIELNPEYSSAYFYRGFAWERSGEFEKAIQDYNRTCHHQPDIAETFAQRGKAFYENENTEKAEDDLLRAVELKSEDPEVYQVLGHIFYINKDYEIAIQHYDRAISLDPELATAYLYRGEAYLQTTNAMQASLDFSRTIILDPDSMQAYERRAIAFENRGRTERAIEDYMKVLEIKPDNPVGLYNLGLLYNTLGETTEMVDYLNRYLLHASKDEPGDDLQKARDLIEKSKDP